jgi:hypothetical protein
MTLPNWYRYLFHRNWFYRRWLRVGWSFRALTTEFTRSIEGVDMSRNMHEKIRSYKQPVFLFLRIAAIAAIAVLLFSLFLSPNGGIGLSVFAFDPPNQSPLPPNPPGPHNSPPGPHNSPPDPHNSPPGPHNSPPGPHNSPPGPFNSHPGPFNSPPGPFQSHLPPGQQGQGNGQGNGPSRRVYLSYVPNPYVYSSQAKGIVTVTPAFRDDHPTWPGFPQAVNYQIDHLDCLDFGFDRQYGNNYEGRWFYTLYMTLGDGEKVRLQSFNPGCGQSAHHSAVYLPDIPEEALFNGDLLFEVYLELDDDKDTPIAYPWADAVIMRGSI